MEDRRYHVLEQVRLEHRLHVEAVAVLARDEHTLDLGRTLDAVLVDLVANRYLRLAIRPQVGKHLGLPHLGEALRELVGQRDRKRHQLGRLVGRVSEHHSLVSRAEEVERIRVSMLSLVRLVHPARDVSRLLVDRHDDTARLEVEAVLRPRVADLGNPVAHHRTNVDVRLRRDLACDDDQPGRDERLARHSAVRVVGEDRVENRVRDLVGDLVGMALGHRLGRECERTGRHAWKGYLARRVIRSWARGA